MPARFFLVAIAHVVLILGVTELSRRPEILAAAHTVFVRLVELPAELPAPVSAPAVVRQALPQPVIRRETPHRPEPSPLPAAVTDAPVQSRLAAAPQPPSSAVLSSAQAAASAAPVVTTARFDADYLHNPEPVYPVFSRRRNEAGTVLLRVRVSAEGTTLEVELKQSSGYPRLDAAAHEAVSRWRFVPARRGDAAIESWVGVPIVFKLGS